MSFRLFGSPPRKVAVGLVLAFWASTAGHAQDAGPNPADPAAPEQRQTPAVTPATGLSITWEVRNRFRLFRDQRDFERQVEALDGHTVLEAERSLAEETDGRGWARDAVARLCVDQVGRVAESCVRDGVQENYLSPADYPVTLQVAGDVPAGAMCSWSVSAAPDDARAKPIPDVPCGDDVMVRVRRGGRTTVSVDVAASGADVQPAGAGVQQVSADIVVRDFLIAGLGDSVAAGDGNPDRPVALSDQGFCFRRFGKSGGTEYFRPGRVGFSGDKACDGTVGETNDRAEWSRLSARWMSAACHRSLYGYQLRAALALAVENPHVAVTFLPLACTGATIDDGLFGPQRSREINCGGAGSCPSTTPPQIQELRTLLAHAQATDPQRTLDLVFLTIGANDINFSGLIADAMIEAPAERSLFARARIMATPDSARAILEAKLPDDFVKLRAALKPLVGGALEKVVFVTYGHPALGPSGGPCPGGRGGFDVHPAFGIDAERLKRTAAFVQDRFFPTLKAIVTCTQKGACANPSEAMTFTQDHQPAFAEHGFCARAETDPEFDRECFRARGESFDESPVRGATEPMACGLAASNFRAYASRARWIRTANDSYFAAMTFPEGVSAALQPSDLHDALWGVMSAVYGGAIHPTAEGHAAMADAALAAARNVLHLAKEEPIEVLPLPPLPSEGK